MVNYLRYSYLLTIVTMIIVVAITLFLGWLILNFNSERTTLAGLQFTYEDAVQSDQYSASVRTMLRDIKNERQQLESLTEGLDPVEVIRLIENIGLSAGVSTSVSAVNPGGVLAEDPSLSSFVIVVNARGTFERLFHFVTLMETASYSGLIEQVKFEKLESEWSASLNLRIFAEENI
jgi:hypothetical protein